MERTWRFVFMWWPVVLTEYVAIVVVGAIVGELYRLWLRWRRGKARKQIFALIKQIRTRNRAARTLRHELKAVEAEIQILKQQEAQRLLEEVAAPCDSFEQP